MRADKWLSFAGLTDHVGHSLLARTDAVRGAIIRYHSVGGTGYEAVSTDRFRRDIGVLAQSYDIVDFPDLLTREAVSDPRFAIALTFDDGYADFHRNVVPILQEFDAPATVFVVTGTLQDRTNSHDGGCHRYLNRNELLALTDEPLVTIGNHTRTHPRLADFDDLGRIRTEILGAKHDLEELGIAVDRFCYPYGSVDSRSHEIVRRTHDCAVTVRDGLIPRAPRRHRLPRVNGAHREFPLSARLLLHLVTEIVG